MTGADADAPDRPTVEPLPLEAEELLSWLRVEKGRSPSTLAAYRTDLRQYVAWLREGGVALDAVGEDDVTAYVAHLQALDRKESTVKRAVVVVRSLHRFLAREGTTAADPASDVVVPKVPRSLPKALAEDEVVALLDAVVGDDPVARRDRVILEVLYGTGLRISELVGLSLADVDTDDALVRAFGKGSKERIVPLGRVARAAVVAWLAPGGRDQMAPAQWQRRGDAEALLLNARGGRLSRQGAWGVVRKHGARVGLEGKLTPHVLRHSCATHMLDHGADVRTVQELLGHASVSTTQIYTKVSTDRLWAVYRDAHPRARA